jgi:general secretion pathway protein A
MYEKHFHLTLAPFTLNPDVRFLYVTPSIKEALATLAYGVTKQKGFVLLTGDVGTGKTTLLNVFVQWLEQHQAATAFVFNPRLRPDDFIDFMMNDFGIPCESSAKSRRLIVFNQWLLERQKIGKPVVLIVDEAQQLPEETLEELRLLTNLETPTQKLLQIVLSGQSELERLLAQPSLRQLKQRISLRCKTLPLSYPQTAEYITRRLLVAGGHCSKIFRPEAIGLVYQYSRGVVRLVNQLCENALMNAFCDDDTQVGAKHVEAAARDLEIAPYPNSSLAPAEPHETHASAEFRLSPNEWNPQKGTHE